MKFFSIIVLFALTTGCASPSVKTDWVDGDFTTAPGWVSVFQTFTSDSETSINILRPHLTEMLYVVQDRSTPFDPFKWEKSQVQKVVKTTSGKNIHWKVDRIHVTGLDPKKEYRLMVINKWRKRAVDWRYFKTLDLSKKQTRFIVGSCMSDSHAFEHVRSRIWDRMLTHKADFLMLLGDQVYVDDFDFVKRGKAGELDIWRRYIDSFRKIPLFQNRQLIPILSVWDDHDYGTNNSDKTFKSKKAARKIYTAFFGGEPIKGIVAPSKTGVYFDFNGFGQKFLLMDNRYFREPDSKKSFGQWGKTQHQWFKSQLKDSKKPVWIANGGQFFTKATFIKRKDGSKKQLNETFVYDHPKHFKTLIEDIKTSQTPVMFLSGDIHYSEITTIEKEMLGYQTYEITSSPIHSYIFRSKKGPESWLDNPRRLISTKEHNYVVVDSMVNEKGVSLNVESYGVKQAEPYFSQKLNVTK